MARRKSRRHSTARRKGPRTTTRGSRRRRMGATSALSLSAGSPLLKFGPIVLGFFKPDLLPISKMVGDKVDAKIVAGAEVGLGYLLAMRKGKKKGMLQTVLGGYLLGSGLKKALVSFGVMSGIGPYGRVPVIGTYTPNNAMNGYSPSGTLGRQVMNGVGYMSSDKGSSYKN